jgi:hypothetical protein
MPADFLDTSALAKHYHAEIGSTEVDRLWNDPGRGLGKSAQHPRASIAADSFEQ